MERATILQRDDHDLVGGLDRTLAVLPRVSLETALYVALGLAALTLRLADLGRWPLSEGELATALAAWRTVKGSPPQAGAYVPLLYDANLFLFALTRATDAAARLLPALMGALLALVPYGARDVLGRRGALMASSLLALSPTWLFFSRTSEGAVPAALAGALALIWGWRGWRAGRSGTVAWALVALGLGLTAGPGIYTLIVSALLYALGRWLSGRKGGQNLEEAREIRTRLRALISRRSLLVAGLVAFGSATALALNLSGIGATIGLAAQWLRGLDPRTSPLQWTAFPRGLLNYEFLTLALAVVGAAWGLARREKVAAFCVTWFGLALLMGTFLGHRDPLWLGDALLPLVALAARGAEHLWTRLKPGITWRDGVALWVVCCFHAFASFELASYIQNGQQEFLWFAYLSWGVLIVGLIVHGFWSGPRAALRTTAALALLIMGAFTLRLSTGVAYQTGRDPREPLVGDTVSVQVRDLEAALRATSYHRVGDPTLLDIEYEEGLDPWLAWAVRDYARVSVLPSITPYSEATALVTRLRTSEERPPGYAAQRFRLQETWPEQGLSIRERLRWLLYREPVGYSSPVEVQLWVRVAQGD